MCLKTIRTLNPTKVFAGNCLQRFWLDIPCGHCAECRQLAKEQWHLRTYYHAKKYFDNGGYLYFDTLTYNDENIPHISDFCEHIIAGGKNDFPCFSRKDIRLFMVRLRRYIDAKGFKASKNISYIIVGEYGTTEGKTHRPHYHIILFVDKNCLLDPKTLSKLVDVAWGKGRTDGYMYHPENSNYIEDHIYGREFCERELAFRRVTGYVSKYILKDSKFQDKINERLDKVYKEIYGNDIPEDICKQIKKIRSNVLQFHNQSQGFGLYALEQLDEKGWELLNETNEIEMPDDKKVKKRVKIPKYLEMKAFYNCKKIWDGIYKWELKPEAYTWKLNQTKWSIQHLKEKIEDYISFCNMETLDQIERCLDGRNIYHFAEYIIAYRGRIRSDESMSTGKTDNIESVILKTYFSSDLEKEEDCFLRNYAKTVDENYWGFRFLTGENLGSKQRGYKYEEYIDFSNDQFCELNGLKLLQKEGIQTFHPKEIENDLYNQNVHEFRYYDDLWKLLTENREQKKRISLKQGAYDITQELKEKLKKLKK